MSKVLNYSPEVTLALVAGYTEGKTVEMLAVKFGKTTRSVIMKLSREGVYVKKTPVTKTGEPIVRKNDHATAIGAILRMTENDTDSLTKANKAALELIFEALANSKPI